MAGLNNLTFTILATKFLEAFVNELVGIQAFSTDFSGDAVKKGDKVKVMFVENTADGARDWDPAAGYQIDGQDADGLEIPINKRKYVSWGLTTEQMSQMPQVTLETFATQKAQKLAEQVLADLLSPVTAANYGDPVFTGAPAGFDGNAIIDIRTALSVAKWPKSNRGLIMGPGYYGNVLKDIKPAYAIGDTSVIREGIVGKIAGINCFESNLIPENGEHLVGLVAHPDALLIAMRTLIPEQPKQIVNIQTFTHPCGISITYREWYDADKDTTKRVIECHYGYLPGNKAAIKRIVSQAP